MNTPQTTTITAGATPVGTTGAPAAAAGGLAVRRISSFAHVRETRPLGEMTLQTLIDGIRDGRWRRPVEAARACKAAGDAKGYATHKSKLPAVTLSGTFHSRSANAMIAHSGLIQIDIDHIAEPAAVRDTLAADPHVAAAFISPGGDGVKAAAVIDGARHTAAFEALQTYLYERYGLRVDAAVKDPGRLCFVSYDPAARLNPAARALPMPRAPLPVKRLYSTSELYAAEYPEPTWAVPGVLPVGLSFLAGRPKVGKSWLALDVARAVGTGGTLFGIACLPARVLYIALEDSERRLKTRAQQIGIPTGALITWSTTWLPLVEGGIAEIALVLENGARLIVIDTFSRALGVADQGSESEMTRILGDLQRLALRHDSAVLLVDHHRKPGLNGSNEVDDLMGSTAKAAVADATLGLYRERGKRGAVLRVTGRDVEERQMAVEFDRTQCQWVYLGEVGDVLKDTVESEVVTAIEQLIEIGDLATTKAIAEYISKPSSNVSRALADLVAKGSVIKLEKSGKLQPYAVKEREREYL